MVSMDMYLYQLLAKSQKVTVKIKAHAYKHPNIQQHYRLKWPPLIKIVLTSVIRMARERQ